MALSELKLEFMRKLQLDPENKVCADCGVPDPEYASLSHGSLICSRCCKQHRQIQGNVSHPVHFDRHAWTSKEINMMLSGGNSLLKNFFIMYDFPSKCSIKYKYGSLAALYYREKLLSTVTGKEPDIPQPTLEEGQKYVLPSTKQPLTTIVQDFFSRIFRNLKEIASMRAAEQETGPDRTEKMKEWETTVVPRLNQLKRYVSEMIHSIFSFMKKVFFTYIKPHFMAKSKKHHPKHENRHIRRHNRQPKAERQKWQEIDYPTSPLRIYDIEARKQMREYPENIRSPLKLEVQGFDMSLAKGMDMNQAQVAMKETGITGEDRLQNQTAQKRDEQSFGDKHCEKKHHLAHHEEHLEKHEFLKKHEKTQLKTKKQKQTEVPDASKEQFVQGKTVKTKEGNVSAADMNVLKDVGKVSPKTTHEKIQKRDAQPIHTEKKPQKSLSKTKLSKKHTEPKSPEKTSEPIRPTEKESPPMHKEHSREEFVEIMKENLNTVSENIKKGAKSLSSTIEEIFEQPGSTPPKGSTGPSTPAAAKTHEESQSKLQPEETPKLSEEQIESMRKGVSIITQKLADTFQTVKETVSEGAQELKNKSKKDKEKAQGGKDEPKHGTIEKIKDALPLMGGRKEDLQELASKEAMKHTLPESKDTSKQPSKPMEKLSKPIIEPKSKSPRISRALEKVIKPGDKNADIFVISPSLLMPGSDGFTF